MILRIWRVSLLDVFGDSENKFFFNGKLDYLTGSSIVFIVPELKVEIKSFVKIHQCNWLSRVLIIQ